LPPNASVTVSVSAYLETNSNNEMFGDLRVLETEAAFGQLSSQHPVFCIKNGANKLNYSLPCKRHHNREKVSDFLPGLKNTDDSIFF